jgi:hypothetical protein
VNEIRVGAESSTEWIPPKYTAFFPYRWFNSSTTVMILCRFNLLKRMIYSPQ